MKAGPLVALSTLVLAACSGGGAGTSTVPGSSNAQSANVQLVTGTLSIGTVSGTSSSSSTARRPDYVSVATSHAYVFINGSSTPNNASSACTNGSGTTGTGTYCTINWTAALAVPASYTFAVETDDETNVLAEGSATYALVAGTNSLGTLTLNGVVAQAGFATSICTTSATKPGNCSGTITLGDAAGDTIEYTGATSVPTSGNSPTTGTVFDNGNVTFASSLATAGLVIGGASAGSGQTSGGNTFSTFAGNTLSASGVINATGTYSYEVQCASATASGTFGITVGGGTSPSNDVTSTQLGNESPVPTYPSSVTTSATAPSYTCTSGVISSATGSLPVN